MPNVTTAAASPNPTWRRPERSALWPVTMVIAAPTPNSARPLRTRAAMTAGAPLYTRNGSSGTSAPPPNSRNDVNAAS